MSVSAIDVAKCSFSVNGRKYEPPAVPIAVICIDGCGDEYLSVSLAQGRMPHLASMLKEGHRSMGSRCAAFLHQRQQ